MTRTLRQLIPDLRAPVLRLLTEQSLLRGAAFVARCSGSATSAYLAASLVGLPHPVWATMSALVVSQEKLDETEASFKGRIFGTLIGIGAGVAASALAAYLPIDMAGQIALSVGLCAVVARRNPAMRVCMWTGPIVLLTAEPSVPIATVALYRGSEVMLGAFVGAAFHWAAELTVPPLARGLRDTVRR